MNPEGASIPKQSQLPENNALVNVLSQALALPQIRIDRNTFLSQAFAGFGQERIDKIIQHGPIKAGCTKEVLRRAANNVINRETWTSTSLSFLTGLPGGGAGMTVGIAADTLQFFGVAVRLAQQLTYLYGAEDIWQDNTIDTAAVMNQFVLYMGVMFGVGSAAATMRVAFAALGKRALRKLPQKALTKTWYYTMTKAIAKTFGAKMTKGMFAKGVAKALPIVGGLISGGMTFVSMGPMGNRLVEVLEEVRFDYTHDEFAADVEAIRNVTG